MVVIVEHSAREDLEKYGLDLNNTVDVLKTEIENKDISKNGEYMLEVDLGEPYVLTFEITDNEVELFYVFSKENVFKV